MLFRNMILGGSYPQALSETKDWASFRQWSPDIFLNISRGEHVRNICKCCSGHFLKFMSEKQLCWHSGIIESSFQEKKFQSGKTKMNMNADTIFELFSTVHVWQLNIFTVSIILWFTLTRIQTNVLVWRVVRTRPTACGYICVYKCLHLFWVDALPSGQKNCQHCLLRAASSLLPKSESLLCILCLFPMGCVVQMGTKADTWAPSLLRGIHVVAVYKNGRGHRVRKWSQCESDWRL